MFEWRLHDLQFISKNVHTDKPNNQNNHDVGDF